MFSVVIPLFQKRGYIQRALDSVYAQSIEREAVTEIVVVNDGSTDGGDVVARAQTDPRVRVLDQPNRGVSAARNAGIAAAGQPFLAFLDADDRWRPTFLARMRDLVTTHPGAMLYGAGYVTMRAGRETTRHGIRPDDLIAAAARPEADAHGPVDFFRAWDRDVVTHSSCIVVPRQAAVDVGGFPEGVTHTEDYLFWAKLAVAGAVVLTSEPLAEYDASVPGQAVEYWTTAYTERFDILEFHRFLAAELRRRGIAAVDPSFAGFARRQLRTAVLQRLYWGNFAAVDRMWRELRLDGLGLGPAAGAAAWMAGRRVVQPAVGLALAAVRGVRTAARRVGAAA